MYKLTKVQRQRTVLLAHDVNGLDYVVAAVSVGRVGDCESDKVDVRVGGHHGAEEGVAGALAQSLGVIMVKNELSNLEV